MIKVNSAHNGYNIKDWLNILIPIRCSINFSNDLQMRLKPVYFIILINISVHAQVSEKKHTVYGYITDSITTEILVGANIFNKIDMQGTSCNSYGFYSLSLPSGQLELICSYVGYTPYKTNFYLDRDTVINIALSPSMKLKEVKIIGSRSERISELTQMSSVNISMDKIKTLPTLLGETDIMKVLQLMPGIQSGGEGTSGLYVRGGGPDQNLILLDGVPVYNVSHLFGFFSLFNTDAINSMEIIKGGYPARYGGRVSSVLDIRMKEGNNKSFHGEGNIGLVSSKFTFEGPISKERTSFIVSFRRTYLDILLAPYLAIENKKLPDSKYSFGYHFYDITAKINHKFSDRDRIYISTYMGDDKMFTKEKYYGYDDMTQWNRETVDESKLKWGNIMGVLRWNHIFTNKLFANTIVTYSRYRLNTDMHTQEKMIETGETDRVGTTYNSGINDWSYKLSLDYIPSPKHYIRTGLQVIHHTFTPGMISYRENLKTTNYDNYKYQGFEYMVYAEDDYKLNDRIKANVGMHWSAFNIDGRFYNIIQPRISTRYLISRQLSFKASYSRMGQYVHLLANSNMGLPMDLWVPSTNLLKPQTSNQIAIGMAQNFKDEYEISVEGYYRTMNNVLEYKEGTSFLDVSSSWEKKVTQGDGRSYGIELFLQKKTGSLTGWLGYTVSWTDRVFNEINNGKRFPFKYDRRHDISLVLTKKLTKNIELSGTWVFGSGNCVTLPTGVFYLSNPISGNNTIMPPFTLYSSQRVHLHQYYKNYSYSDRNAYRMPPYHRLDLSISFLKKKKWGERRWIFGLYNAYGRKNPFYMDVSEVAPYDSENIKYVIKQHSLFPIIPSISYQFKF